MSDIKIDINGEEINKAVADAIVKSILGDAIVKMVNEYVKQISLTSYNNPVKEVIDRIVKAHIEKLVNQNIGLIESEVRKQMSHDVVATTVMVAIDKLMKAIH